MSDDPTPETPLAAVMLGWEMLRGAAKDRRMAMHTVVVATIADGVPDQRVMVLRAVDGYSLRFHTDARAPKLGHVGANQRVHVLGYDAAGKVQLRLSGAARIDAVGTAADAAWNDATLFARRTYLTIAAPGTASDSATSGLPAEVAGLKPSESQIAPARANFATIIVAVDRVDWLWLASTGHRRAVADLGADGEWAARWVVP